MSQQSVAADVPMLPRQVALAAAWAVAGLVVLSVVLGVSGRPFSTAIASLVYATLWGVVCRFMRRLWDDLIRLDTPGHGDWRRGILLDMARVGVLAVAAIAFALLGGPESIRFILCGTLLGVPLRVGLGARDLHRWQTENDTVIYTRVGARLFAMTSAPDRFVGVVRPT